MSGTAGALQHLPFFEALATGEESSALWRETCAGLVTLRLFDTWMSEGAHSLSCDGWGVRSVREAIADVDGKSAARALLTSVVDAIEQAPPGSVSTITPRLMAYARTLQFEGRWPLAIDVYRTILAYAKPVDDADVVISANMYLGSCLRVVADFTEAQLAYTTAAQIAALTGDVMNVLRARVAEGNLAMDRGNLPQAEEILDDAIARAATAGYREVQAVALQDRSVVARRRGDRDRSVTLAYDALELSEDPTARDRVLGDLAAAFFDMGLRSAARDAHLILAATAQEQYVRWVATINLMEIAALDFREPVFEQYRRELEAVTLPVSLAAYYHFYVGQGFRMFARMEAARAALKRAIDIASQFRLNEVLLQAEASLHEMEQGCELESAQQSVPSERVAPVTSAIRRLRALAGVGE